MDVARLVELLNKYYWDVGYHHCPNLWTNQVDALKHFLSGYAFERQRAPALYREAAPKAVEQYRTDLQRTGDWMKIRPCICQCFISQCEEEDVVPSDSYNLFGRPSRKGKKSIIEIVSPIRTCGRSLAKWMRDLLDDGAITTASKELPKIRGIASKMAAFYLRDISTLAKLDLSSLGPKELRLLQPIDIWTRRAATCLAQRDKLTESQCRDELIKFEKANSLRPGQANIAFWVLGARILKTEGRFSHVVNEIRCGRRSEVLLNTFEAAEHEARRAIPVLNSLRRVAAH
jgi:hypothetical protein